MPFGGVLVNRVHHDVLGGDIDLDDVARELEPELGPKLAARVAENLGDYHVLARRDRANIERLASQLGGEERMILVPHLDDDVHDVEGLQAILATCGRPRRSARRCSSTSWPDAKR